MSVINLTNACLFWRIFLVSVFSHLLTFFFTHSLFCSNVSSLLTDFLSNFTLKSRQEKDAFFCSLPEQLHSLSPQVLADNVVPLLVSPLIMADPLARDTLWKHLLVPVSAQHPRRLVFNSSVQCPLLDEDLFK